jgi:aspartate carbamoyltransferase regulatory subunit
MSNKNLKQTVCTATLAAGSTTSPYYAMCNITQQLCYGTCADSVPVFAPQFSVKSIASVGTSQYIVTVAVSGIISYVRCGSSSCACCVQQPVNTEFTIPVYSASTPTDITLTAGASTNALSQNGCCNTSQQFVCETPLTLTVVTSA